MCTMIESANSLSWIEIFIRTGSEPTLNLSETFILTISSGGISTIARSEFSFVLTERECQGGPREVH